jgi:cardiolipin synthase (CMP-forming)
MSDDSFRDSPSAPPRDSFFTIANVLSLSRLPLGFLFAVVFVAPWGGPWGALVVLAVAGITDALDGRFARRAQARRTGNHHAETPAGTGSWLDPICDKLFVATVLAAIWFQSRFSLAVLALILGRELAQLPLSLVYLALPWLRRWLRYDFRASFLGKAATVAQFAAITALLFRSALAPVAAGVSFGVGMLALTDYLVRAVKLGRLRAREVDGDTR